MIRNVLIILISFLYVLAYTQPRGKDLPKIGKISGLIVDFDTKQQLPYVTVSVYSMRNDELITGAITDNQGRFVVSEISIGKVKLKADFMGYETYIIENIIINRTSKEHFFDDIELKPKIELLEGVEITADKPFMENRLDKLVVNIDKDIVSKGGNALEAMESIPAVDVDTEGNISLRGNDNVKILIDGRPSGAAASILLEQLPADQIENIEIITNPSAKYDPEGVTGIINIVLKKNIWEGFNGSVSAGAGLKNRYNASVNLNYRNKKMNLFTSASLRQFAIDIIGDTERNNYNNSIKNKLKEDFLMERKFNSSMIRLGGDFFLNPENTLSFSVSATPRMRFGEKNSNSFWYDSADIISNNYKGFVDDETEGISVNSFLSYKKTFSKAEHFLQSELNFSNYSFDNQGYWEQSDLLNDYITNYGSPFQQENFTDGFNQTIEFKVDYEKPIGELSKFEAGINTVFRKTDSDFSLYNMESENLIEVTNASNHFIYDENIYAVYMQYATDLGWMTLQAGLRAENVQTTSDLKTASEDFNNNYFSFYPSLFLMKKLSETDQLKLNYSRRVNRPRSRQLNPFGHISDPYNIRTGNPNLMPEYINSVELTYAKYITKGMLSSSIFYRYTTDVIRRVVTLSDEGVSKLTYDNLDYSTSYGVEMIASKKLKKWWNANASFNLYQTKFEGSSNNMELRNSGVMWNIKTSHSFNILKSLSAQISGRYYAPRVIPQGSISSMYMIDAGLKKDFFNRKLSLNFRVRDVFDWRKFEFSTSGDNFNQNGTRNPEGTIGNLSLTWKFGKLKFQQQKRNNHNSNERNDSDGFEF